MLAQIKHQHKMYVRALNLFAHITEVLRSILLKIPINRHGIRRKGFIHTNTILVLRHTNVNIYPENSIESFRIRIDPGMQTPSKCVEK